MPARRDTQMEASRLRFLSPLQTVEDQSLVWGIRCHSCTGREGLPPSWKLSYKAFGFALYPRTSVLFRSTGRTELQTLLCHSPVRNAPAGLGRLLVAAPPPATLLPLVPTPGVGPPALSALAHAWPGRCPQRPTPAAGPRWWPPARKKE